ncbi:hypothetical protein CU098_001285, partial [Rhizopus stolonifer]
MATDPSSFKTSLQTNNSTQQDSHEKGHFTFRSVVCGLMIGTLMCFSNMYFGLQTGWISMMSLQSSLLGFAIFKPFQPMLRHTFGPIENVVLQTTAVATATMPLAAGFVGVIPAMELMTKSDHPTGPVILSGQQLILWSLAVAFFGVFFAIPLRKQTIIREKLNVRKRKRPEYQPLIQKTQTHYATVPQQNQASFEYSWSLKLHGLIASFTASSIYTLLSYFVPAINVLPVFNWLTFGYVDMRAWEWYFTPSFSYIGQGIIMGLPTTLSMLLGCVVGWGILSPMAYYAGWAPGPVDDWKTGSKGWILWISLGVMIAESCISLLIVLVKTIVKGVPHWVTVVGLIASTLSCIYLVRFVFGPDVLPLSMSLLAVFVAMFLSILGVRALGETDLNPVSGIGKISQVLFAGVMPGGILANLIAGGIAEAGAQQAGDLMQDLKTGHLLKASPKAQFYGQMIGSFASVFIASGAYMLYRTVYSIPGPEFPVPTAQ